MTIQMMFLLIMLGSIVGVAIGHFLVWFGNKIWKWM